MMRKAMQNPECEQNLIIYHTADGQAAVSLYARDGNVWMNQNQLAELFATSVTNISTHISNILKEKELDENSVIKDYLTTVTDGKQYNVILNIELLSYPALTPPDKQAIESLLKRMTYLAITPAIEDETIEFRRIQKTKLSDSIIAATAKHYQLELLTLDKQLTGKL